MLFEIPGPRPDSYFPDRKRRRPTGQRLTAARGGFGTRPLQAQRPQQCGTRRRHQLPGDHPKGSRAGRHAHHQAEGRGRRDRQHPVVRPNGALPDRQPAAGKGRRSQVVEGDQGPHSVDDGIDGTHLVEVHRLDAFGAVGRGFGLGQLGKGGNCHRLDPRRDEAVVGFLQQPSYLPQVSKRPVRGRVRSGVVVRMGVVVVGTVVGMRMGMSVAVSVAVIVGRGIES
mmetsp:Transcript_5296/g.11085  ORF Transcript_5296/g.11085 Transcript_5296/m.11085 type:complete len:226 (+) Transcript_5296:223-900(+)